MFENRYVPFLKTKYSTDKPKILKTLVGPGTFLVDTTGLFNGLENWLMENDIEYETIRPILKWSIFRIIDVNEYNSISGTPPSHEIITR